MTFICRIALITVQELEMYRVYCEYKSTLKNIDLKLEATKSGADHLV